MILPALVLLHQQEQSDRVSAIYRFPASEATPKMVSELMVGFHYDSYCIEPRVPPAIRTMLKGKIKIVSPESIDTPANMKWRNATIAFVQGKISPKTWVQRTRHLGETVHFLSNPKTEDYRTLTGNDSGRPVMGEMLVLMLPGLPCFTSSDIWITRELPDAGRLQSWILAMHDWLGPELQFRHDNPFVTKGPIEIVRADPIPGMLRFLIKGKPHSYRYTINNSEAPIPLPNLNCDRVLGSRGLYAEDEKSVPQIQPFGTIVEELP